MHDTIQRMARRSLCLTVWTGGLLAVMSFFVPQSHAQSSTAIDQKQPLTVVDEGGTSHSIAAADFAKLPRSKFKATTHTGEAEFEGASLVELLKSVGVEFGEKLKGKRAPTVAVLEATDDYRVVVTLLEIDPATTDVQAYVVDRMDGQPLDAKHGPYRLVIPSDKREIRWIRNLRSIRINNLGEAGAVSSGEKPASKLQP